MQRVERARLTQQALLLYPQLDSTFERLDARNTRYRFDLERDVPWELLGAKGLHLGDAFLSSVGIDGPGLNTHPEAYALFQWAVGLEISQAFSALEGYLLDFVDEEHVELKTTRSVELLYEEERKHIALFDRYASDLGL